jgi:hypothetical protein
MAARDVLAFGALIAWFALLVALGATVAFAFFPEVPPLP